MVPFIFAIVAAILTIIAMIISSLLKYGGQRVAGIIILALIMGPIVGLMANVEISKATMMGHLTGYRDGNEVGLERGYYSGVPENDLRVGSIYQYLGCVPEVNRTVFRDPEGRVGLFQIQCLEYGQAVFSDGKFYQVNPGGRFTPIN